MFPYTDEIKKVWEDPMWREKIKGLGLTEKEQKLFTALCVVMYDYWEGDVLAGMVMMTTLAREEWRRLVRKVFNTDKFTLGGLGLELERRGYFKVIREILG